MERLGHRLSVAIAAIATALPCVATSSIRQKTRQEASAIIHKPEAETNTSPIESPLPDFSLEPERLPNPDASLQRLMNDIDLATGGESVTY